MDIEFNDFPNVVRQLVATIVRGEDFGAAESEYKASFKVHDDEDEEEDKSDETKTEEATKRFFIIYQKLEFCKVQICKLAFEECDIARVEKISQARYDEISAKLKAVETEFKDIYKIKSVNSGFIFKRSIKNVADGTLDVGVGCLLFCL